MVNWQDAISVLFPLAKPLVDFEIHPGPTITRWNPALGTQPTQAQLDAVTQAQVDAAKLAKLRDAAKQFQQDLAAENRALRAVVKLVVDELNILRQTLAAIETATTASTNYATLKSGLIAAIPPLPDRTYVQARNAIDTLIDSE